MRNIFLENGFIIDESTDKSFTKQFEALSNNENIQNIYKSIGRGLKEYFNSVTPRFLNTPNMISYGTVFDNDIDLIDSYDLEYDAVNKLFYVDGVDYYNDMTTTTTSGSYTSGSVSGDRWPGGSFYWRYDAISPTSRVRFPSIILEPDDRLGKAVVEHVGSATASLTFSLRESNNETAANWTTIYSRTKTNANPRYEVIDLGNRLITKYYSVILTSASIGSDDFRYAYNYAFLAEKTYHKQSLITANFTLTSDLKYFMVIPVTNYVSSFSEAQWNASTLKVFDNDNPIEPFTVIEGTPGNHKFKIQLGGYKQTIRPALLGFFVLTFGVER